MCTDRDTAGRRRLRGLTLVETIVSLLVISVGVIGVLSTMNAAIRFSAEPMIQKQMTAIAESLLAEVLHQPFTFCDPDDANALSAKGAADCTGGAAGSQDKGGAPLTSPSPAGEARNGAAGTQFDNVADYGGFSINPVTDVAGANAVAGYAASVAIDRVGASMFGLPAADDGAALRVTVTVTRGGESFVLSGYRFRYAPRY